MKKQRSIVTQTVMRVSGVFITAIILLTIVFTIFIGRYMRDNILRILCVCTALNRKSRTDA